MRSYLLFIYFLAAILVSNSAQSSEVIQKHFKSYQAAFDDCKAEMVRTDYWGYSGPTFACTDGFWGGSPRLSVSWYCPNGRQNAHHWHYCWGSSKVALQYTFDCPLPSRLNEERTACVVQCPADRPDYDENLGCIPKKGEQDPKICPVLDPIYPDTGESYQPQTADYVGSGSFPLKFSLNYKSYRALKVLHQEPPRPELGEPKEHHVSYKSKPIGNPFFIYKKPEDIAIAAIGYTQWRHSYQLSLYETPDASKVVLSRENGKRFYFSADSDGKTYNSDMLDGGKIVKVNTGWLYSNTKGASETYDNTGRLVKITNQQGLSKSLTYNASNQLEAVTDAAGRMLSFLYDEQSRLKAVTAPDNSKTLYVYGAYGNLAKVTFPDDTPENDLDNPIRQYFYEDSRHPYALTKQLDGNGDIYATWTYDDSGKAIGSRNFDGHREGSISYAKNEVAITEANSHQRTMSFDDKGRLASVTGGDCGQCSSSDVASYRYNTKNQLIAEVDFNGVETRFEYNARSLQTQRTEAFGTPLARVTTTKWHSTLSLPINITSPMLKTVYAYGVRGRLESITETDLFVTESLPRVTTYSYNTAGLLHSIDGPRTEISDITTFAYNANHDLINITDAAGNATRVTSFDVHGHPTTIVDENGVTTTLTYDVRNRLISQSVATHITNFEYDNIGQLTKTTLPSGAVTNYVYSGSRLLKSISDGQGNSVNYTHDNMGNVTKIDVKDSSNNLFSTQQQLFDGLNRLTSQVNGLNQTTAFGYDAVGNQVSVITPLLKKTTQVYDAFNRLSETIDAKLGKTVYGYDSENNLTSVKAPNNAKTTYRYDGFGNLLSQTSPDTGITSYTYDMTGNQLSKTDAKNITVHYNYDGLNRLTSIGYPDDTLDVKLTYDTGKNGKGRLSTLTDGSGSTAYSYTALGRVSSKVSTVSGKMFTVYYAYNGAGQLIQITLPSGRIVNFTHDTHGKIIGINELHNGVTQHLITNANYVPFGLTKSLTLGNGKVTTKTHNLNGQLATIDVAGIYQSSLIYNSDSNITGLSNAITPASNQRFTYDELDRVTDAIGSYGTLGYSYDSASNRIEKIDNLQVKSLTYNVESNQLASPYFHDVNGNRTKDNQRTYSYGDNNRLVEITNDQSGMKTTYLYNGLGQRVKKSNIFGSIYFIYDEQGLLIAEANGKGAITKEYVYFEGQPLVMLAGG